MKQIVWVFVICGLVVSPLAVAYEQQVTSTLSAEGYSVQSPDREPVSRRRFVEDLQLGAWQLLPGEADPYYDGPRLSVDVALRLLGDASIDRSESDPSRAESHVPGLEPVTFDVMVAYVDAVGFWNDTMDIRAGRQIRIDTLGFFAFDGVDTRMRLPIGLDLSTYIGAEVRGGHVLGYDELELDGTDRGGRKGLEADQYLDREEPGARLAMGTELFIHPSRWFELAAGFRAVGINGGIDQLADERIGAQASVFLGPATAMGRFVFSPLVNELSEADAEIGIMPVDLLTLFLEYHRFVPVFEGDSIFNVFDLSSQNDLGARVSLRLHRTAELAAWGFARLVDESAGLDGEGAGELFSGAGGGIGGNYKAPYRQISMRVSGVQEWGESRFGAELGAGHAFLTSRRWWLGARVSVWYIDDQFSEMYSGLTAGYVLSTRYDLSHRAHVLGEFEHYLGDGRNRRFYALALLQLDLWR